MISENQRHPIILSHTSHVTHVVVAAEHLRTLHGGIQPTLASLRRRYWVLRGRQVMRHHVHRYMPCALAGGYSSTSDGEFAESHLLRTPGWILPARYRCAPLRDEAIRLLYKAFVTVCRGLFVYFSRVHLEAVSDYIAEAFLVSFRRFVSRKGLCRKIYSDCGTNFVGADPKRELFRSAGRNCCRIVDQLANEVKWHFNLPVAPLFGGL